MSGTDFFSRALDEGRRYGGDKFVFLRELAQNARDAGATRVDVTATYKNGQVEMTFRDDGVGMTFAHAKRFLFTLYASSKESDADSAGRFGVGFWSVLLFEPSLIQVDSKPESKDGFSVYFSGDLSNEERGKCVLKTRGTRVRLVRRLDEREGLRTCTEIERAIVRYCSHLRQNDRGHSPLPIHLNGLRIDRPFTVDGPCWMTFSDGPIEGVVGLGPKPRVELYARGLLVWRGASIDELRYGVTPALDVDHPAGLSPVYVLNGNSLAVTMDRRAVIDDAALRRLRRTAKRRMRELVRRYLDTVAARPWTARVADGLAGFFDDLLSSGTWKAAAAFVLAIACVTAAALVAVRFARGNETTAPMAASAPAAISATPAEQPTYAPLGAASAYVGPSFQAPDTESTLPIAYSPRDRSVLFRIAAVESFDVARGAVAPVPTAAYRARDYACAAQCLRVRVRLDAAKGLLPIPTPTGHAVETGSIRLDGRPAGPILSTGAGEPVLEIVEPTRGVLEYVVGPTLEEISPKWLRALKKLPSEVRLTGELEAVAASAADKSTPEERVAAVVDYMKRSFTYDRSPAVGEEFRRLRAANPRASWFDIAASMRRGDCDVENALAVALVRRAGVPARLAIGYAGESGVARPGMHAWIEYYDNGFRAADATPPSREVALGPAPVIATAPRPPAPPPTPPAAPRSPRLSVRSPAAVVVAAAVSVAALAALLGAVVIAISSRSRKLTVPKAETDRRRVAAEMLLSAFTSPDVWLKGGGLDRRPLLPVLGNGAPLSLDEARRLSARGELWFSTGRTGLSKRAAARGARVLDAADASFGEIAPRIPGAQDLDAVARLDPKDADALPSDQRAAGRLIEEASSLLERVGAGRDLLRPCAGLAGSWMRDVDLRGLSLPPTADLPRRFVAVSPTHPVVKGLATRTQKRPGLGAFLLVDAVVAESGMLAARAERIRERAAAAILEGAA